MTNMFSGTAFAACGIAYENTFLSASFTQYLSQHISFSHQRTQHSIVVRPTAVRVISTDIICQTIVQHCRTSDLELTATCCVKLQLSLYFQIHTKNSVCFLLLFVNCFTYLFLQRLCSCLTALRGFYKFCIIIIIIINA